MSAETKAVADFYARLFPWIDHGRDVRVCHDDGGSGAVALPDLCFHFVGGDLELRIEFKTWERKKGGVIGCTVKQLDTWTSGSGSPHLWVAVDKDNPHAYSCWEHDAPTFRDAFRSPTRASSPKHGHVAAPKPTLTLASAFIEVLTYAHRQGMLP